EGYVVDIAGDGEEGLYLALNHSFDLIVLDLMLPIKDGLTVCAELREKGKNIPILILTAKNSTQDKVSGLDLGANDYITKPFAFEEFLARIRALLRNKNNSESTRLKIHDLDMDLLAHKVYRGGKEIALTSKEFSLLEYLMRNKGSIVTRTMITEHVWEINFDSFTNVIDVYINYLRNKIDKGYDKKLIHTVRSRGYSIKE
ncbi:MAG TPA: winged helix-turn-helix domain-containing protein, partial [Spirochaetota bacterium]|nr:winged helix-turn-helix domain-containing protein [Spirochaetota bacterium]